MGFAFSARTFFQNKLINMYAKCGSLVEARKVFDDMRERDGFSWNVIIAVYQRNGYFYEALALFQQMQRTDVQPDHFTFSSVLPACAKTGALEQGIDIHQSVIESGFLSDVIVASSLVDMYAKCGRMNMARQLFEKMFRPDVVCWNAMIAGYALNGFVEKALEIFKQMQLAGVKPNSTTFVSILPACAKVGALEQGLDIHQSIIESQLQSDVVVMSALVDMYAKCGRIEQARELFDKMSLRDAVSWNAMIVGYAQNRILEKALETFKQMQLAGVKPTSTTFASILPVCAKMGALEQGMDIHQSTIKIGLLSDISVANALIDMYSKCGSINRASDLFDKMFQRDVVSWNAMIAGYSQNGLVEKALEAFKQLQLSSAIPDSTTFACILPACAKMGALEQGTDIHQTIIETRLLSDVVVMSALVDMYAKCGSIEKARETFDRMSQRDVVSWNSMIAGYAQNGMCKDALKLFERMGHSGTNPNHVSFACVLFACSHAGLVNEGCIYFNDMSDSYCFMPKFDHYLCMVDLLGRAGYLEETLNFIIKMPIKPMMVVWMCLLGACNSHENTRLGVYTATLLFELDPENVSTYVHLSNIYAKAGRWSEAQMVRRLMKDTGIKKTPGCSWIEVEKIVYAFVVGDRSHPHTQEIYTKLDTLYSEIKASGYLPDSRNVLINVEDEEKELFLCHHSEKLAIAFGLLKTPPGTTIRVVKNLRVCVDCHTVTKFISKIVGRQIVVRDANRFHHFKKGQCSCRDYW